MLVDITFNIRDFPNILYVTVYNIGTFVCGTTLSAICHQVSTTKNSSASAT